MFGLVLIVAVAFGIGLVVGGFIPSPWAFIYPVVVCAGVVYLITTDEYSGDMDAVGYLILGTVAYTIPAFGGTLLGIGLGKALRDRS